MVRVDQPQKWMPSPAGVRRATWVGLILLAGVQNAEAIKKIAGANKWSPRESVEMTYFVESPSGVRDPSSAGEAIVVAPDGDRFFFVTRRGDLACDCVKYGLQVFEAARVQAALSESGDRAPSPEWEVSMASGSNHPAISSARWADGGAAITFLGASGQSQPNVFRLDVVTGELARLTGRRLGVAAFDASAGSVIYLAQTDENQRTDLQRYPALHVTSDLLRIALGVSRERAWATFSSLPGAPDLRIGPAHSNIVTQGHGYWLAPDGHQAIAMRQVPPEEVADSWARYGAAPGSRLAEGLRGETEGAERFFQFELIDLDTGRAAPLLNAPTGMAVFNGRPAPEAYWLREGKRVIIVNSTLPLDRDIEERQHTSYVLDVDVVSGAVRVIVAMPSALDSDPAGTSRVKRVAWDPREQELLVSREVSRTGEIDRRIYAYRGGRWSARPAGAGGVGHQFDLDGNLSVELRQSANTPPAVIASNGEREIAVTAPDPVIAQVRRSRVDIVHWRDSSGRQWTGGLMLPLGGTHDRVPLVIQIYDFEPDKFLPDGTFPTAYAAQPLASQGLAVLQMRQQDIQGMGTPMEGRSFVDGLDSAVEYLDARGLIDPERVGLIGFSRGGYLTDYAIANPGRTRLAAAVSADGADFSYLQYLILETLDPPSTFESAYGTGSFWENKEAWLQSAPGFNADRIRTPLLLTASGHGSTGNLLHALELFQALRINGVPVDLLFYPEGEHQLRRPRERLTSLQASVDWMVFWLMGRKPSVRARSERFDKWSVGPKGAPDKALGKGK